MLKRIYIHNYRTFVNFEWEPPPVCVLVGPNGSGKSALLEVFWILQDLLVEGRALEETTLPRHPTAWLNDSEQTIEIEMSRGDETFVYRLTSRSGNGRSGFREELRANSALLYESVDGQVKLFGDHPGLEPRTVIPFTPRRSFIAVLDPRPDNTRLIAFRDLIGAIWAMKPNPASLTGTAMDEVSWLERDLSNFAAWYRSRVQEDPEAVIELSDDLRQTLEGFKFLRLQTISSESKELRVQFDFSERKHEIQWLDLSDGQRQLIALYGMLRFGLPTASFIALDEIENYVAPAEIQPWLRELLDMASEREQQVLLISHHPESIEYTAADAVWRMWRDPDAGHSRIAILEPDLSVGESAYDLEKRGGPDGS